MKKLRAGTLVMLLIMAFMLIIILQQHRAIQHLERMATPRGTFQSRPGHPANGVGWRVYPMYDGFVLQTGSNHFLYLK